MNENQFYNLIKKFVNESIKTVLKENDNIYDYDGNYEQLIKDEYHNLCDLETKVPYYLREEIHSMVVKLQGIMSDINMSSTISKI